MTMGELRKILVEKKEVLVREKMKYPLPTDMTAKEAYEDACLWGMQTSINWVLEQMSFGEQHD